MIWEIAGILSINPLPYTFRELAWMVKAHQNDIWVKISHVMASALNANPFLKEAYKAADVNPYRSNERTESADSVFAAMHRDGFFEEDNRGK